MALDSASIIAHAQRFIPKLQSVAVAHDGPYRPGLPSVEGLQAQVIDFLGSFAGPKSPFTTSADAAKGSDNHVARILISILEAFIDQLNAGLLAGVSPERQAQLDVVSDLLGQAHELLNDPRVHPAAPTVLIGASLEEFLRTWVEATGVSIGNRKPSISAYAAVLREADLLQKQDVKDIESWGGLRNHAAHGEWELVGDARRVRIMLEGVNLFMRRYSPA